ncbi:TPA: DNA helicase, partial [Escherichia coli]|nr:DNA helicase [Escherichia coli]HAW2938845.1 DNA helicase [Escherichia coli]
MMTRQYAQKSIFDLEAIFERSHNNIRELEKLLNELSFRNTSRAQALTTKIKQALNSHMNSINDNQVDLDPLPPFLSAGKANDTRAILTAWTALEALSPQSYKHPEDMAAGDRSRVVLLERGIPWGPNACSKPNYKLYFEVILGAITLDKATEDLVKIFGEDEEFSRPDGKKVAIGSLLIDKNGY